MSASTWFSNSRSRAAYSIATWARAASAGTSTGQGQRGHRRLLDRHPAEEQVPDLGLVEHRDDGRLVRRTTQQAERGQPLQRRLRGRPGDVVLGGEADLGELLPLRDLAVHDPLADGLVRARRSARTARAPGALRYPLHPLRNQNGQASVLARHSVAGALVDHIAQRFAGDEAAQVLGDDLRAAPGGAGAGGAVVRCHDDVRQRPERAVGGNGPRRARPARRPRSALSAARPAGRRRPRSRRARCR